MAHFRCGKTEKRDGGKYPLWLDVIHRSDPAIWEGLVFDEWWSPDVQMAELYDEARVLFRKDLTVSIISTTDRADESIRAACAELGVHCAS